MYKGETTADRCPEELFAANQGAIDDALGD